MMTNSSYDAMFSGIIGQDYWMLQQICPNAVEMSRQVGLAAGEYCCNSVGGGVKVLELGGGTGITTLSILTADERLHVLSVDNESVMQNQARENLQSWANAGRLEFCCDDALRVLQSQADESFDLVASCYTLHNFERAYRRQVLAEIYRILKPKGRFINGDRYAFDDIAVHTSHIQQEAANYFRVLTALERLDLLEHWIIHLFNDESENHIMREAEAIRQLTDSGFTEIGLGQRIEVNALLCAVK